MRKIGIGTLLGVLGVALEIASVIVGGMSQKHDMKKTIAEEVAKAVSKNH